MMSQHKTHSVLVSNMEEKIHHLYRHSWDVLSPTRLPVCGNTLQPSDQVGKQKGSHLEEARQAFRPTSCMTNVLLKTRVLFHLYTQDTTHLWPEDFFHFHKCAATIYFLFTVAHILHLTITYMCHKSGVQRRSCLQTSSPGFISYGIYFPYRAIPSL